MNVVFTESDGTVRRWDGFKPDRLMSTEAEAIEKVTGLTFGEWGQSLMNGGAAASRALVWVLRKREEPTLRYKAVDFPVGDLSVTLDAEERQLAMDALEKDQTLSDEDREQVRFALQAAGEVDELTSPGDGPGNAPAAPTESAPV